eukprot:UN26227
MLVRGTDRQSAWYKRVYNLRVTDTNAARVQIGRVTNYLRNRIQYDDQQDKLRHVEGQFEGQIFIVHPERKFIRSGDIHKLGSKNGQLVQYTLFLFNDILIYASNKGGNKYKHHRTLHLCLCSVKDHQSHSDKTKVVNR